MHTRFLSDLLDLDDAVACVFDSDPGKIGGRFLDWPVHGPEALAALDLDAVVISTHAFEDEVFTAFDRGPRPDVRFAGMMQYDGDLKLPQRFLVTPPAIDRSLNEYLVRQGPYLSFGKADTAFL